MKEDRRLLAAWEKISIMTSMLFKRRHQRGWSDVNGSHGIRRTTQKVRKIINTYYQAPFYIRKVRMSLTVLANNIVSYAGCVPQTYSRFYILLPLPLFVNLWRHSIWNRCTIFVHYKTKTSHDVYMSTRNIISQLQTERSESSVLSDCLLLT